MKGKTKILALVMALAMVSSMFVACSNNPAPATSGESQASVDASSTGEGTSSADAEVPADYSPKMAEATQISWYIWGDKPNQADVVVPALNEKSAADINVTVDFKFQTGDQTNLNTTLASGDKDIDIAFACAWFADYVGNSQQGYFRDLTEDLNTYAPNLAKLLPENMWKGVRVNGKIYGLPVWKDTAATQYWIARKDILEAAGAAEDFKNTNENISSLKPVLEKIKAWHDADPAKNAYSEGCTAPLNTNWAGLNGIDNGWDQLHGPTRIGIRLKDGNTKVQSFYDDEYYVSGLKALKEFADLGLSNGKDAVLIEQEPTLTVVGSAQGWDGAQYSAWGGPVKGYDAVINKKTGPFLTSAYVQGGVNCVGAGSEKVEAALKYMQYGYTDPTYINMLNFGVEGVNWKNVDGRCQVLTGNDWAPGGFVLFSWQNKLPPVVLEGEGDAQVPAPAEKQTPLTMYKDLCAEVNTATASSLLGFVPNTEKVQNELSACISIVEDNYKVLQCGAVDDVDAYIADLKAKMDAVGYQTIISEFQAQVDAFVAANK